MWLVFAIILLLFSCSISSGSIFPFAKCSDEFTAPFTADVSKLSLFGWLKHVDRGCLAANASLTRTFKASETAPKIAGLPHIRSKSSRES